MEPLCDPRKDRRVKNVKPPPHRPLSTELLFPKGASCKIPPLNSDKKASPDWKLLRNHLHREGTIQKKDMILLIENTNKLLSTRDSTT